MRTTVNAPVKVRLDIDSRTQNITLHCIKWEGRTYTVRELGIKYPIRDGRKVVHVFCVNVGTLDMRLHIDADTLHATLIEISDGFAD
jgi:hypothetical protein